MGRSLNVDGAGPAAKPRGGFSKAIMARSMQTPRTGKRSKKAKEKRKHKQKEEKSTEEIEKSSAERDGEPAVGEIEPQSADRANIELQDSETGKAEEGRDEEPCAGDEMKDHPQSEPDNMEGAKEGEGERETDDEGDVEGEELEGEMEGGREGEESDDDDAPEDITLAEGKTMAMEKQKEEGEQIKRIKASAKQKRKKKYELFKKQKEAKQLRKIAKFSEEGLEIVAQKMAEERAIKKAGKKKRKRQAEAGEPNEAAPERSEVEVGGVRVVALGEESSGGRSVMLRTAAGYEEAANFLKQSLYGGRQKRIPALSLQAKRYRNQPAKNFIHTAAAST